MLRYHPHVKGPTLPRATGGSYTPRKAREGRTWRGTGIISCVIVVAVSALTCRTLWPWSPSLSAGTAGTASATFYMPNRGVPATKILFVEQEEVAALTAIAASSALSTGGTISAPAAICISFAVGSPSARSACAALPTAATSTAKTALSSAAVGLDAATILHNFDPNAAALPSIGASHTVAAVAASTAISASRRIIVIEEAAHRIKAVSARPPKRTLEPRWSRYPLKADSHNVDGHLFLLATALDREGVDVQPAATNSHSSTKLDK